ncbi:MAG: hypothetical protein ABR978_05195 [Dehalococcoidia bacterium]|jgi:hypothetical protein
MKKPELTRYEEQVPATWWLRAVMLVTLAAMLGALVGPAFDSAKSRAWSVSYYPVMALASLVMVASLLTFRRLSIRVTDESVTFGFGVLRKTLLLGSIRAYEVKKYKWLEYGGWGLRFSLGGRRAYSLPGTPMGVEITSGQGKKERRYFVSSRYPDRFAAAIGGEMSAPSATWQ